MKTWQLLGALVRRAPWLCLLILLLQFPRRLIRLVPGLVIKAIFDLLAAGSTIGWDFWGLIALLVGVALARATLLVGTMAAERFPIQRSLTLLRTNLLREILRQPGAARLPMPVGDAVNRLMHDPYTISFTLVMITYSIGVAAETFVALGIMASINLQLTIVAVLPVFIASWALQLASGRVAAYARQGRDAAGQVQAYLGELFGAVQAIQAVGAERAVLARLNSLGVARRRSAIRERLFADGILGLFSSGGASMATGAILLIGGDALRGGSFSVGDFALFVYYLTLVEDFVGLLIGEIVRYQQAGVAQERLLSLVAGAAPQTLVQPLQPGEPVTPPTPARTSSLSSDLLVARQLHYTYPGSERGIHGVNLRVKRGQLVVITGQIGSGKTTLLRLLLGLLPCDAGKIEWNGVPVTDPTGFFGPPRTAYTPQVPQLFSITVRDNILLGLPPDTLSLNQAVKQAALEPDIATLEHSLDTLVGPCGMKLSGGQVQRTAAARMLVRRPELLVVDDLSSALDVETEQQLWQRLRAPGEAQTACLAVSHRHGLLRRADHIVLLENGVVAAEGTAEQLLRTSTLFRRLWQDTNSE